MQPTTATTLVQTPVETTGGSLLGRVSQWWSDVLDGVEEAGRAFDGAGAATDAPFVEPSTMHASLAARALCSTH